MKPERFKRTKSVVAGTAIALVVAALVIGLSSLVFGPRSASPQQPGFDLTSNPSSFTISSAIYASPACGGTPALLYPGTTRCAVFSVHNLLGVPITVQSITSLLDGSFTAPPPNCAPPTHFTLPTFSGSVTVGAGATTALPGVPIKLLDNGNQDNCQNFQYHFTYTGSAVYTDSTGTTLTSTPNPANLGQSVTFKATVAAGNPSTDANPPSGTVSFYKCTSATVCPNTSANLLGTGAISAGVATFSTSTLAQDQTFVDAVYPASDTNFTGSTSGVVTQDVQGTTTTMIASAPNPSALGASVAFTATVAKSTGTGSPTGTVSFFSGTPSGTHTLLTTNPLNSGTGKATYSTSSASILPIGTDHLYALYNGDTNFSASTSPVLNQVVTTAACSSATINGGETIKSGQFLCFTGTVNGGVTIQSGGGLYLGGAKINGGITSTSATSLIICGSTINGNISATSTTGFVRIGDGGDDGVPGCATNTITGNVSLTNNKGGFEFAGNKVTGTVTLSGNTGSGATAEDAAPEVEGNNITGSLSCATSNTPGITDGGQKNTVTGTKSGQCAGERVLMARHKHGIVPTDQMVPADPVQGQLPLGRPPTLWTSTSASANGGAATEDEGHDYWGRATGRQHASRPLNAPAEVIPIGKSNGTSKTTGAKDSDDENDGYWARARGIAPRRPSSSGRPVPPPKPAALSLVPESMEAPPSAMAPQRVTQHPDIASAPLAPFSPAPVCTDRPLAWESDGPGATEIETTIRGAHVRKDDPIVAPVRGAHVKAEDPLADAAWHIRLAEDEMLSTTVSGAHVKADDPLVGEVQAAHAMGAVAPLDEPLAPQGTDAGTEAEVFMAEPSEVDSSETATLEAAKVEGSAGDVPERPRRRRWHLVPVAGAAAALAAGLGGGGAYAYFTSHGSGTGHAATGTLQTVTVATAGTPNSPLLPGGPAGDVTFAVSNSNSYAVTLVGVVGSGTITADASHPSCTTTAVTFTNQTPNVSIPASSSNYPIDLIGAVTMGSGSSNGCQGATFTIPITITVNK